MATIIFDFDGTIADSFDFVIDFLSRKAKKPVLSAAGRKKLKGISMAAAARELGHGRHRHVALFFSGRRHMGKSFDVVRPVSGMPEVIVKLAKDGHKLFIVSNNSTVNVDRFLRRNGLRKHFDGIQGNAWVLGKRVALTRLAVRQKSRRRDLLYIGDELCDVRAARAISAKMIAVTWGFSSRENLRSLKPTLVAHKPADILRLVNKK